MSPPRTRYRLNVAGDFYVEDGCCTFCGVPAVTAPDLFGGFDDKGAAAVGAQQCWVKKQPSCASEVDAMLDTMAAQDLACIRYSGSAPAIIRRLRQTGEAAQIDRIAGVAGNSVAISAKEWELVSFFGDLPTYRPKDEPWPYTEIVFSVHRAGLGLTCAILPAYRDLDIRLSHGEFVIYELNAIDLHDIRYKSDGGEVLEIEFSDGSEMSLQIDPQIQIHHSARSEGAG